MSIITKLSLASVLALSIAAPAAAQEAKWSQSGDYYAPSNTIVQQPSAAEAKQAEQGDYYAPAPTIVQRPSAHELKRASRPILKRFGRSSTSMSRIDHVGD